jgi:hypothetical protein
MPDLPLRRYLRRGVVRDYFGIDDRDFTKIVEAKVLEPHYLFGGGRAFFKRDQVVQAEAEGKIFRPERKTK